MSKIGLIGCGRRLRDVLKHLLQTTDEIEVHSAFDPYEDSVLAVKETFNKDVIVYDDYKKLLKSPDIDWVMIGSWNCQHKEHVIAAFEAGKHVFCEKPLALNLDDCLAIREAWIKSGKNFCIGFTLRYSPHYRKIKEVVSSGALGKVISMEFNETLAFNHGGYIHGDWRRKTKWAGSHMLEKCCHDLDLVNWILDSRVSKTASFGGCDFFNPNYAYRRDELGVNEQGKRAYETWSEDGTLGSIRDPFTDDKDILDNQVVILEYENSARATFHTNCNSGIPERRMYINGTEGCLRADVLTGKIEIQKIGFHEVLEDISSHTSDGHGGGDNILGLELRDCILKGDQPKSSLVDGLTSAVAAFGIDLAQQEGRVVDLTDMWEKVD